MPRPGSAFQLRHAVRRGHGLVRALLFAFWCFVLWGTLIDLGALWMLVSAGPQGAWENLRGLSPTNVLLAALALLAWTTVAWIGLVGADRDPSS